MNFTPFPNLKTKRLNLRRITSKDLSEFFILKSDERLLENYQGKARNYEQVGQFINKLNDGIKKNAGIN